VQHPYNCLKVILNLTKINKMKQYKTNCPELKATLKRDKIVKIKVTSSQDSADFFRQVIEGIDIYESFFVLYLNQNNNTIGWYKAAQGGITSTICDARLIMKKALEILATGIILCHNHPSGNIQPSDADKHLTAKIKNGCSFFDIRLLDHVILTEDSHFSFNDEGLI
jgi:DNA repair protein RadC